MPSESGPLEAVHLSRHKWTTFTLAGRKARTPPQVLCSACLAVLNVHPDFWTLIPGPRPPNPEDGGRMAGGFQFKNNYFAEM